MVGMLHPFPLGTSKFHETYGIGKMAYQDTIVQNFTHKGVEISKLH